MHLQEIASEAILTGLESDGTADVTAVRWIACNAAKAVVEPAEPCAAETLEA
jgi:hypothetical protein